MPIPKKDSVPQRKPTKGLVYKTLCDQIIRGEMMPSKKLLDAELATYFNVDRTPVCEALQMLETQKLIRVTPGRATTAAGVDKNDIEKYYRPLAEIQGLAVRLAAPRLTEAQPARTEGVQVGFEEACRVDQAKGAIHCGNKLHEVIPRVVDDEYIMGFSRMPLLHVRWVKYHYFRRDMLGKTSMEHHRDILGALYNQDVDLTAELMRNHWLYVMKWCLRKVEVEGMQ